MKNINNEQMKLMKEKPVITEDMCHPCNGTEQLVLNCGFTIHRRLKEPIKKFENIRGMIVEHIEHTAEQDVDRQLVLGWNRWPIPETYVDKAMSDMAIALKSQLRKHGLMR